MKSTYNPLIIWTKLPSWQKILLAMIAGTLLGLFMGDKVQYIKPVGTLFINAIKMMIVPVIFTAIVCAILAMDDTKKMRRVGIKTLSLYMASMVVATIIGLCVATLLSPGMGLSLVQGTQTASTSALPTVMDTISNIIPANPIVAFSSANILQILVFAIFIGISINLAGEKAEPVKKLFQGMSAVVFKLAALVMSFAPYGIFALMAVTAGEFGYQALIPLFKVILAAYVSAILLVLTFYSVVLSVVTKLNPLRFFQGIASALILAFSSSSSTATLPVSLRCAEDNLGISRSVAGFLLPLGTTLNLNGLAIYLSVVTVFAANVYGMHLGLTQYATLLVTIVLTSMGAGGIPGSGLIVTGAVMTAIGLPLGAIPLIAGIDRILDMGMTATNVAGDLFATTVIAKSEKELDHVLFNASDVKEPSSVVI